MDHACGKIPQAGLAGPAASERCFDAVYKALDINRLENTFLCIGQADWHTSCSLWFLREAQMSAPRRVLIIDPDPRDRRDLRDCLKQDAHFVDTGRSLSEAIKKVSGGGYDCLVMDINLPEMKGYEAVPILKSLDPKLKIIITTKKNTKTLEAKVREQNIFYYFIKSFGKDELRLAIQSAFNP
jgi:CheY-like chemotaxis protein